MLVGEIKGIINPVMAGYVSRVIDEAERANAGAVVFSLDTPGGLSDATRDINLRILVAFLISSLNAHLLEAHRHAEEARREAQAARALAEEAVRIRDNFLASVAHDLKSPLTVVSGQAELLLRRLAGSQQLDPAAIENGLGRIRVIANRMRTGIDELMDVARVRGGRWSLPGHRSAARG